MSDSIYFQCSKLQATLTVASCDAQHKKARKQSTCAGCDGSPAHDLANRIDSTPILEAAEKTKLVPPPPGRMLSKMHKPIPKAKARIYGNIFAKRDHG